MMQLPETFISRTKALLGKEWELFEQALNRREQPTSVRLNPQKTDGNFLHQAGFEIESPVLWASNAYYLRSRPVFTLDPHFHAGCYYVQEASSMFLEHFIKNYVREPVKALDLCAAPGGKSTHLSAILPEGSLLVANEVIRPRANILSENLTKWGNPQTVVTNNYPADIGKLQSFFDLIVCDLPCSGEGMFRKDPGAIAEWSVRNVKLCAERQKQIISDIFPALKPGGILIYSTCTYNREENEDNIDCICRKFELELLETPRRFLPHKTKGEGFFIAALRKGGMEYSPLARGFTSVPPLARGFTPVNIDGARHSLAPTEGAWLSVPDNYTFFSENKLFFAFPADHYKAYLFLKKSLKIVSAGITLGEVKGNDLIPNHALAMSTALSENAFPRWDSDRGTALKYLRKETLQKLPAEVPLGFVIVTYQNRALGFIKNIGNRANNLYLHAWRIRNL